MMEERRRMKALLKAKGRILESLLSLSRDFSLPSEGAFDESKFRVFQSSRSDLLRSFALHEKKITETAARLGALPRDEILVAEIQADLARFEGIFARIEEADARVLDAIRAEQERLHQGMTSTRREAKTIGRFKSAWAGSAGSELDQEV